MAKRPLTFREILASQGVTSEESVRFHTAFVAHVLEANPSFDFRNYRVNPQNISVPYMG